MAKVFKDSNGKVILANNKAIIASESRNEYGNTGTVDTAGLTELGWNENDIAWLQKVCWWDAEDNDNWVVSQANKAFGPNGATPLTWSNLSSYAGNKDIVFFPKLVATSTSHVVSVQLPNLVAIPTDGWTLFNTGSSNSLTFFKNPQLVSVGDLNQVPLYMPYSEGMLSYAANIRFKDWYKITISSSTGTFNTIRKWFGGGAQQALSGFEKVDMTEIELTAITDNYATFASSPIKALKINKWDYAGTDYGMFQSCVRLRDVYANEITKSWSLADCSNLSRESCLRIFNALSSTSTGTITLHASAKARLSDADRAIATDKGWTIA